MGLINVPITKAGAKLAVETDDLPEDMYAMALAEGLKVLLNSRMSKITTKGLEGDDLAKAKTDALARGQENLDKLVAGKFVKRGAATDSTGGKVPGVVMTEALRLAKAKVKDAIRAAGMRVSHVEASEITKAAKEFIAADPSYIDTAKANIEARTAKPVAVDISKLIHESPKLVAKSEKAKAERKTTLSATQAGKTKIVPKKANTPAHVA